MKIYLAADHGGFEYKQQTSEILQKQGWEVVDCGAYEHNPDDDYPQFVTKLAKEMQIDPDGKGIVVCRSGVGVSIVANRFMHLRCGLALNKIQVKKARLDDNINVLAIAADYFSLPEVVEMVTIFLNTPFSNLERHTRRLAQINQLIALS